MIILHHLNNSRSQRILWMLEELQLPYTIERYQRDEKTMLAPASLKKIHPLGKSPVLQDGDLIIAESGAILEYLQETYDLQGLLKPADPSSRLQYRYWMHYAEGSLMPLLVMKLIFGRLGKPPMPWLIRPIAGAIGKGVQQNYIDKQLATHAAYIEDHLTKNAWFAGETFSAADIQMSFPIEALASRFPTDKTPHLKQWLAKIQARPAYQQALKQGGPYQIGS
ncbi:glutathione S-transferase family protein [Rouxiella badensis]|jgi:glutathione S-transferase|uniref:glutathione transferase n=2 Tax=Rouxiella badensis TaxID=1646377 RepID=A0A1X0WJZ9_9GAMM|nr:glutathione S-transferase [Rouxiella badensis]MCC3702423.1 glutathione S-transferase [Rouxiella badensis]MCC3718606.1 glutathione S-transferase [Rouxiella badensis]MCC3728055.1 glutathione S-transferase [Rouxiella badensis]MCC3732777.1 glutathione S-transferase [Rouxiella badensis]MCC3739799.1 glutathione S-transferase [Rouxiella badensis]